MIELQQLRVIEDRCWRQKSSIKWLKEGDLNACFLHKVVSGQRCSSPISLTMLSLIDNMSINTLRVVVSKVFKQRFKVDGSLHINKWNVEFLSLDSSWDFDARFSKSFIFLISKVKSLISLNDFRPISLLGWVYELIAKVLTGRIRSIISQLVSHSQTSFIQGRSIH